MDLFGPLASMHAALDHVGLGRPCAISARFKNRTIGEVKQAIAVAALRFPVLQRRLIWGGSRPILVDAPHAELPIDTAHLPLLSFSTSADGSIWRVRLTENGPDVRLDAVWAHAIADGLSMLAFLQAVSAELRHDRPSGIDHKTWPALRHQPFAAWLPRFLLQQHRPYRRIPAAPTAPVGASWFRISRQEGDRVLERASQSKVGFAAWLAAAALRSLCDQQGLRGGNVLLNVPILRHRAADGFGFGIGSLILSVPVDFAAGIPTMARFISHRLRRMAAENWDDNFKRLLGRDPRRHRRFALIQRGRPDPMITVSWKGRQTIGDGRTPHDVACFAASPSAHISAHADEDGLSISLTSPQSLPERHAILGGLAALLDCSVTRPIQDLE